MLGVEALGVFALGQAEPWTLKGKEKFARTGRGKQPTYTDEPKSKAPKKARRRVEIELPQAPPPLPTMDGGVVVLLKDHIARIEARKRDEEDAIAVLLMTH
jgi:hypothetical protein